MPRDASATAANDQGFVTTVAFSPELTWTTVVQWDSDSDNAGLNSRVRYEPTPGRELFVVFSQGFNIEDERRLTTTSSALTVKLGLTFRF